MRPLISILIALAYLSFNISKDKLADGYVILQSGDRKEVKFILLNKSPLVIEKSDYDFSESRMQHSAKYIDADGKKEKVKPKELKEFGFTYSGRDFVYRTVKVPLPGKMPFLNLTETEGFL